LLNRAIGSRIIAHPPAKLRVDDFSQYLPVASAYTLGFAGIRGRHDLLAKTEILGIATLFLAATVNGMKYTVRERRPDKSAANSFPSGHTAVAFMGAEFLRTEYRDVSAWYGVAGYLVALGTGALRIYNNKHWLGDVAFGAGLGILCTRAAYWIYPAKWEKHAKKGNWRVSLSPYCGRQHMGLSLSLLP
jgi:membrane-associated phospholipid phosphatase